MNPITTLGVVLDLVNELSADHYDCFVPVKDMWFIDLNTLKIGDQTCSLTPAAQRAISQRLGVPLSYLQRCGAELQRINLNEWLPFEQNEQLFLRFDGNRVRAFFTPRYQPVDHEQVLNRLLEQGFSESTPVQCNLDDDLMVLNIPDQASAYEVRKNDEVQAGLSIVNSETGASSLSIAAFWFRLVCTNGMIIHESSASSYRHVSKKVLNEFPKILERVSGQMHSSQDQWRISLNSHVDWPEDTLKSFNHQFNLGKQEIEAVDWAFPQEPGNTMFHIVNAYTKGAHYHSLNVEQSVNLQRTGGRILAMLN